MSLANSYHELEDMLRSFRCQDLASLLSYAGQSKNGKKCELLERCVNILKKGNASVQMRIREIYNYKIATTSGTNYSSLVSAVNSNSNSGSNSPDPSLVGRYASGPGNYPNSNYNQYTNHAMQLQQGYGSMHPNINTRNAAIPPNYNQNHIRVQFEKLAFYEYLHELQTPFKLMPLNPNINNRPFGTSFNFAMTTDQANEIIGTRELMNGKLEYTKQIHLRFGYYDKAIQVDNLPPNLNVTVNGKQPGLPAPKPTSKPNADIVRPGRSVDITPLCRLAPNIANKVEIHWTNPDPTKPFCIGVYVFKKLSVQFLLSQLKQKPYSADLTRQLVIEKLQITDSDFEIETNDLKVSLMCPLMKFKMNTPGRATNCKHVQCFDLESYLMMNEKKPTWNCPVCDQNAPYDNLVIDSLNQEIIKECGSDAEEITFLPDGSWKKAVQNDSKSKASTEVKTKANEANDESCYELLLDDTPEKETTTKPAVSEKSGNQPAVKKNLCVIDLTLDSSDDEAPPPTPAPIPAPVKTSSSNSESASLMDQPDENISNKNSNNNQNVNIRKSKEASLSPSQSIISISSTNSTVGSRSTTPVPDGAEVDAEQKNLSANNDSPNKKNTTSVSSNKNNQNSNSASSSSDIPMDTGISSNNKNGQSINTTPTLSNFQLARGLSMGTSPNTLSPNEMNKTNYNTSYSNAKPSTSLTSVTSIIENTNLPRTNNRDSPNHLNPNHSSKPTSSLIKPSQSNHNSNSNTASNHSNTNGYRMPGSNYSSSSLMNRKVLSQSGPKPNSSNISESQVLANNYSSPAPLNRNQESNIDNLNQIRQDQIKNKQMAQAQSQHRMQQNNIRRPSGDRSGPENSGRRPIPNRMNEHTLVGMNHNKMHMKRNDFNTNANRIREKAMMTLNNELKSLSSNPNTEACVSNKNRQVQNTNYNLKEQNLSAKIDNTLKRSSFDTDLPQNSNNKKPNMMPHLDPRLSRNPSPNNHGHMPNKNMHHLNASRYPNSPIRPQSSNSRIVQHNQNNYSNIRAHTPNNNHQNNYLNQQSNYSNQSLSPSNHHSPTSPGQNYQNMQRQVYSNSPNHISNYNSGIPNQYQYHTQHLRSPRH